MLVFAGAAVACFGSLGRALRIDHADTRRGLVGLLVTSGGWAVVHVGFLVAPTVQLKLVFYHVGLFIGLSTVGPWLYFCSAYTGRTLHRSQPMQRAAIAVFVLISAVKATNPLHQQYFRHEVLLAPFPHLSIDSQPLHWLAMGLAYALAMVGYFMLYELFRRVGHDTTPLLGLVGLTGLPIVLDALAEVSPTVIKITYEPLGVAVFAIGVLFFFLEDFQTVQLTGDQDDPVIVLDDENRVRDFNVKAKELFPELDTGEAVADLFPGLGAYIDSPEGDAVFEFEHLNGLQYYRLGVQSFSTDSSRLGSSITLTDVTEREEYRRELERQNERLEQFASMVSHDLRNPLTVAQGRVAHLRERDDNEHLVAVSRALDRMEDLIGDVLSLARQGQPIDEREQVRLLSVATDAWASVESAGTLSHGRDGTFLADSSRLQQLLENLFRNAVEHGSTSPDSQTRQDAVEHGSTSNGTQSDDAVEHGGETVTVSVGVLDSGDGFYVADDGVGIPEADRETVLESGYSTAQSGTGLGLAIVTEIVAAHDWTIAVTESADGGARFEIRGIAVET